MKQIAGSKGKVHLYPNFDKLSMSFNELLQEACGELVYLFIPSFLWLQQTIWCKLLVQNSQHCTCCIVPPLGITKRLQE